MDSPHRFVCIWRPEGRGRDQKAARGVAGDFRVCEEGRGSDRARSVGDIWSTREAEGANTAPESGFLQDPDTDNHDYNYVEDCIDTGCHGNVTVDQRQQHANDDQNEHQIE